MCRPTPLHTYLAYACAVSLLYLFLQELLVGHALLVLDDVRDSDFINVIEQTENHRSATAAGRSPHERDTRGKILVSNWDRTLVPREEVLGDRSGEEATEANGNRNAARDGDVAVATALMKTEWNQGRRRGKVSYVHLACALGMQLRELYPARPRIVLVKPSLKTDLRRKLIGGCGYTEAVEVRPVLPEGFVVRKCDFVPKVYGDQSMKFGLWNFTRFDRIVFFDSDTFFHYDDVASMRRVLAPLTAAGGRDELRGCPTPWSNKTLNGSLFSLEPSGDVARRLFHHGRSTFFKKHGAPDSWFDCTEMGPMNEVYEGRWHMVKEWGVCISTDTKRLQRRHLNQAFIFHGLKPRLQKDEDWDNYQRNGVFLDRGYSEEALDVVDVIFAALKKNLVSAGSILEG